MRFVENRQTAPAHAGCVYGIFRKMYVLIIYILNWHFKSSTVTCKWYAQNNGNNRQDSENNIENSPLSAIIGRLDVNGSTLWILWGKKLKITRSSEKKKTFHTSRGKSYNSNTVTEN